MMLTLPLILALLNLTALISAAPLDHHIRASSSKSKSKDSSTNSTSSKTSASGSSGGGATLSSLFPVDAKTKWTTLSGASGALPLSDATLNPFKAISALKRNYTSAPDGAKSLAAHFPKGAWGFGHQPPGGMSFYAPGPKDFNWKSAKEVVFGYSIYFEKGFQFNKGGKLPGIYGGSNPETAVSCSGGRKSTDCFSVRLMFRTNGQGEFYTYLPPTKLSSKFKPNEALCKVKGNDCNDDYGWSIQRGAFSFKDGAWNTVSMRVLLNDVDGSNPKANGELELWVNGDSKIKQGNLVIRGSKDVDFLGIMWQTFFGGSNSGWASPRDQWIWFNSPSAGITKTQ